MGPVVGAVIGGFTNKVAIKMLFRPYEAKYIGKWQLPFTPGIIPKEKSRIAENVGGVICNELLNSDVLSQTLLSEQMLAKIEASLDAVMLRMKSDDRHLSELLLQYVESADMQQVSSRIEEDVTEAIYSKLDSPQLGKQVAKLAVGQVIENLSQAKLGGRLSAIALDMFRDSVENFLSKAINDMLHNNAQTMVGDLVHQESQRLQNLPVRTLAEGKEEVLSQVKSGLMKAYRMLVVESLPKMLSALDIKRIVEDRINSLDMVETERIILDVVDKQLKALVWFGVGLGFLMGFVTNLMYLL